jgi:hypothetical protein
MLEIAEAARATSDGHGMMPKNHRLWRKTCMAAALSTMIEKKPIAIAVAGKSRTFS